jgi:hypothetical protein
VPGRCRTLVIMLQQGRTKSSYRTDLITVVLGTWFSLGLFLDAWAHANIPELESFFTPWHAVFYSGFAATGAWISWLVWRNFQQGKRGLAAVPAGYGPAVIALPVFALFGAGDFLWHTFIGIEQSIDILFSPTHLGLISTMIVILSTPLRTAWADRTLVAPSLIRLLPAVLSLAFSTALVLLFAQYADATIYGAEGIVRSFSFPKGEPTSSAGRLAASIVLTNLILLAPLLLALRRWRLPFGTATVLQIVVMLLSTAVTAYETVSTALGFVLAGLIIDVIIRWLRPSEDRLVQYRAFAMLAPFVTWTLYFVIASSTVGRLPSVTEMWTGAPIVAALHGLLLAVLLVPTARRR